MELPPLYWPVLPASLRGMSMTDNSCRRAQSPVGDTTPGQVVLSCVTKWTENAMEGIQSAVLLWWAVTCKPSKPFAPQAASGHGVYNRNGKQARTVVHYQSACLALTGPRVQSSKLWVWEGQGGTERESVHVCMHTTPRYMEKGDSHHHWFSALFVSALFPQSPDCSAHCTELLPIGQFLSHWSAVKWRNGVLF